MRSLIFILPRSGGVSVEGSAGFIRRNFWKSSKSLAVCSLFSGRVSTNTADTLRCNEKCITYCFLLLSLLQLLFWETQDYLFDCKILGLTTQDMSQFMACSEKTRTKSIERSQDNSWMHHLGVILSTPCVWYFHILYSLFNYFLTAYCQFDQNITLKRVRRNRTRLWLPQCQSFHLNFLIKMAALL